MASTDGALSADVAVEALGALDAHTLGMLGDLVAQSGWNQTRDDWALFAAHGTVHAVRDGSGRIVASGAVLPMGPRGAWISMILVDPALRGQGMGRAVFAHCMRQVQSADRVALLDATPAGEKLYARYGFVPLWRLTRWQRAGDASARRAPRSEPGPLDLLAALDAEALGLARPAVLAHLALRAESRVVRHSQGFAVVRAGRVARHVGPLIATHEAAAAVLLADIADSEPGPLFIDVPDDRPLLREQLAAAGFAPQRAFARMALGDAVPQGQTAFIHAIAGPEYG